MDLRIVSPHTVERVDEYANPTESPIPGLSMDDFIKLSTSICVFVPHRPSEGLHASFSENAATWREWGIAYKPIEDSFGGEITLTRAGMVKTFLSICQQTDAQADMMGRSRLRHLVMIDNDEVVHPLAPVALSFWDLPAVSGVVCNTSEHGFIKACFTVKDKGGTARFPTYKYTRKLPGKGLLEVHSVGTGLISIRRDTLEALIAAGEIPFHIPEEIRLECWETSTQRFGEDIAFCRQMDRQGLKKYVDFQVRAPHMKTVPIVWPADGIDNTLDPRDWVIDPRDYAHGD